SDSVFKKGQRPYTTSFGFLKKKEKRKEAAIFATFQISENFSEKPCPVTEAHHSPIALAFNISSEATSFHLLVPLTSSSASPSCVAASSSSASPNCDAVVRFSQLRRRPRLK
ncbi:hypothetical protein PIB30_113188, partial [Stylosanthes scabra]|nr:hypothetical protein [Stylosanthes scabra]